MYTRICMFLVILTVAFSATVSANVPTGGADYVITGRVTDEGGRPLPGASVVVMGTTVGAGTDSRGEFKLKVKRGGVRRLRISFTGYAAHERDVNVEATPAETVVVSLAPSVNVLSEAVITGSRTERPLKDVPVITRVISRSEIERVNPVDLQSLLQYTIPGFQFRWNSMSQTESITYMGMGGKMILFLIDGERMSGEGSDHNIDFARINVDDIERIEVVRGAASTLYDSNAQAGVINIITKKADRPISANLTARYAGTNGERYGASVGIKKGDLTSYTSFGFRHRKTYYVRDANGTDYEVIDSIGNKVSVSDSARMSTPIYGYTIKEVAQRFGYRFSDKLSAEVKGGYYHNKRPTRTNYRYYHVFEDISAGAKAKYIITPDHVLDFSYQFGNYGKDYVYFIAGYTKRNYDNRNHIARLNYTATLGDHTLSAGTEYHHEYLKHYMMKDTGSVSAPRYSFYVQEDWRISPRLSLVAGVRADKADTYSLHFTPKVSLLYRPIRELTVRANYSNGYRPPTLKELYQEFDHLGMFYIYGNSELKAETSTQWSGSVEYNKKGLNLTVSAFHNRYRNYITYTRVAGSSDFKYINTDNRRTFGIEATANYRTPWGLTVMGAYNFVDDYDNLNGYNLSTVRPHAITFGAAYRKRFGRYVFNTGVSGRWDSRFSTYSYSTSDKSYEHYVIDARTHCSLTLGAEIPRGIKAAFMIDNLFDYRDKANVASVQTPGVGRSYVLTVNLDIAAMFGL